MLPLKDSLGTYDKFQVLDQLHAACQRGARIRLPGGSCIRKRCRRMPLGAKLRALLALTGRSDAGRWGGEALKGALRCGSNDFFKS